MENEKMFKIIKLVCLVILTWSVWNVSVQFDDLIHMLRNISTVLTNQ